VWEISFQNRLCLREKLLQSTLLSTLVTGLRSLHGAERVVGLPMDGFHLDNVQLELDGSVSRKGAPHTFDVGGLASLLQRLKGAEESIYAPEFDRASDLSRNGSIRIDRRHDVVLIEGNYLLLSQPGWVTLSDYFDLSIAIDVDDEVLERRLVKRWLDHGLDATAALLRAQGNDLPNARTVREQSKMADIVFRPGQE